MILPSYFLHALSSIGCFVSFSFSWAGVEIQTPVGRNHATTFYRLISPSSILLSNDINLVTGNNMTLSMMMLPSGKHVASMCLVGPSSFFYCKRYANTISFYYPMSYQKLKFHCASKVIT
ncbi:hypothetical protein BC941DRAFT_420622 [Chlamydoabsidia padenii]|nr:hypothetical protein BC941DRAFT_420622 [Chlamydoabsidia padenii]